MRNPQSKAAIVSAAERVVAECGAAHLTLDAVALAAGVSKGGLLYNFPSKQALLEGMVETMVTRARQARGRARERAGEGPNAGIRARLSVATNDVVERRAALAILAAAAENPDLLNPVRDLFRESLAEITADAEDPILALVTWLAADALSLWDVLGLRPFDRETRCSIECRLRDMVNGGDARDSD